MSIGKVPYDADGNLMHFAARWDKPEWRPNEPFKAELRIDGTVSGRSAKYLIWRDVDGRPWPMFVTDCVDLMQRADVLLGVVDGTWVVRKRGQNYGLRLAADGRGTRAGLREGAD